MAQKRLGQILIAKEGLKPEQLEQALATQAIEGGRIGEVLMKMRAVTEESVLRALGLQLGMAYVNDLPFDSIDGEIATKVPIGFEKQHRVLPIRREGDLVLVASADPLDVGALDDVRSQIGAEILVMLAPSQKILDAINHIYGQRQEKGGDLDETEDDEMAGEAEELVDILDVND
ncbi:MAG TPA: type II secretion system protein GspE, partial [Polyangia bacterium]